MAELCSTGLNLTQFDAQSVQFHLVVDTSQIFQISIVAPSYQVSRPIGTLSVEHDELFLRQFRAVQVSASYTLTADE